jgi:RNA polymerase sigma-70 factor (ECF subfamily)
MLEELDKPDFIGRLISGEEKANNELVTVLTPRLWSHFVRKLRSWGLGHGVDEADDLVATTFQKFYESLHRTYNPEKGLIGWILIIAKGVAVDYYREVRSRNEVLINDEADISCDNTPVAEDESKRPLSLKEVRVGEEFKKLNVSDRKVIRLRVYDGLRFKEIAKRMDKTEEAVKTQYSRAIKKLREAIQGSNLDAG